MHLYLTSKLRVIRKAHVISSCIIPVTKAKLKTSTTSKQQWRVFLGKQCSLLKTETNRARVTGFRVFCQFFFICDLKEREHQSEVTDISLKSSKKSTVILYVK